jgi:hypothetical protein
MKLIAFADMLLESSLQNILKSGFKKTAEDITNNRFSLQILYDLLNSGKGDQLYVFHADTPAQKAAERTILGSTPWEEQDNIKVVRLTGGRKVAIVGGRLVTTAYQIDKLHAPD